MICVVLVCSIVGLVVIAIIAILAAILFPVFLSAKEKGRQAACFSNLREIGMGLVMYVDDYHGVYVYTTSGLQGKYSWPNRMMSYVNNVGVFKCPSDTLPTKYPPTGKNIRNTPGWYRKDAICSYSINMLLVDNGNGMGRTVSEVAMPSRVLFLEDTWYPVWVQGVYYHLVDYANWGAGFDMDGSLLNIIDTRHSDGVNFCFADGHAKWYMVYDTVGTEKPARMCARVGD